MNRLGYVALGILVLGGCTMTVNQPVLRTISAPTAPTATTTPAATPTPRPTPTATPDNLQQGEGITESAQTVIIQAFAFNPSTVTVAAGSTVTFSNLDTVAHTISPDVAGSFPDSGVVNEGGSKTITFTTVGTFAYHCNIHPSMHGTVVVTAVGQQ